MDDAPKLNDNLYTNEKDAQVESALKLWFTNVREHNARIDGATKSGRTC